MGAISGVLWQAKMSQLTDLLKEFDISKQNLAEMLQSKSVVLAEIPIGTLVKNLRGRTPNKIVVRDEIIETAILVLAAKAKSPKRFTSEVIRQRIANESSDTATLLLGSIRANIDEPLESEIVTHEVGVSGSVHGMNSDHNLWLVNILGNSYHPDNGPLFVHGFDWSGTAYVGSNVIGTRSDEEHTIALVVTTKAVSEMFRQYLAYAHANSIWTGIVVRDGVSELCAVKVIRNDQKWAQLTCISPGDS